MLWRWLCSTGGPALLSEREEEASFGVDGDLTSVVAVTGE